MKRRCFLIRKRRRHRKRKENQKLKKDSSDEESTTDDDDDGDDEDSTETGKLSKSKQKLKRGASEKVVLPDKKKRKASEKKGKSKRKGKLKKDFSDEESTTDDDDDDGDAKQPGKMSESELEAVKDFMRKRRKTIENEKRKKRRKKTKKRWVTRSYRCADRTNCCEGMLSEVPPDNCSTCVKCLKTMHNRCGYDFTERKRGSDDRVCHSCHFDEALSVTESEEEDDTILLESVAKARRERLQGKEGLMRLMDARSGFQDKGNLHLDDSAGMYRFIDRSLINWGWMTQSQFDEWSNKMGAILSRIDVTDRIQRSHYNATREHVQNERKGHNQGIAQLKREWLQTCDGGIRTMMYCVGSDDRYKGQATYFSNRSDVQKTLTMDLSGEWVVENYGAEVAAHLKDIAQTESNGFMKVIKAGTVLVRETEISEIRFVGNASVSNRRSPRKARGNRGKTDSSPNETAATDGYWEGRGTKGGVVTKIDVADLEQEVIDMYQRNHSTSGDNGFVVIDESLQ